MNLIYKILLLIYFLTIPFLGNSQFSYIGAGVALRTTIINKPQLKGLDKTKTKATTFEINGMYRPLRFFAIGANISIPVNEATNFSFEEAETNSGNPFNGFGSSGFGANKYSEYIPETFEYTVEQSMAVTFKARLYAFINSGLYFDFRFSIMSLTESLIIERDAQVNIPDIDINEREQTGVFFPGFGVGLHEHLGKHIFIDLSVNFDFMNIKNDGFTSDEVVYTGPDSDVYEVTFEDLISGKKNSHVFQFSLGYIF